MKRTILLISMLFLILSGLSASINTISLGTRFSEHEFSFGNSDMYKTEQSITEFVLDLSHYHGRDSLLLKLDLEAGYPVGGHHKVTDTEMDTTVEDCSLVVHHVPFSFKLAVGPAFIMNISDYRLICSVAPALSADLWAYAYPTMTIYMGIEGSLAMTRSLTEERDLIVGLKGEYDFRELYLAANQSSGMHKWQEGFKRFSFTAFFGLVL